MLRSLGFPAAGLAVKAHGKYNQRLIDRPSLKGRESLEKLE